MALWPLKDDARMTVLINLMAAQVDRMARTTTRSTRIVDVLRMQLKLKAAP